MIQVRKENRREEDDGGWSRRSKKGKQMRIFAEEGVIPFPECPCPLLITISK